MEVVSDMKFICEIGNFEQNIQVCIDEKNLVVKLGKDKLFRTLSNRKEIVGFINKKLDSLVEDFVNKQAEAQENLNSGC